MALKEQKKVLVLGNAELYSVVHEKREFQTARPSAY